MVRFEGQGWGENGMVLLVLRCGLFSSEEWEKGLDETRWRGTEGGSVVRRIGGMGEGRRVGWFLRWRNGELGITDVLAAIAKNVQKCR